MKPWRQTRGAGRTRKTERPQTRVDPAFAERIDRACLLLGEPLAEFIRRALASRVEYAERGAPDRD